MDLINTPKLRHSILLTSLAEVSKLLRYLLFLPFFIPLLILPDPLYALRTGTVQNEKINVQFEEPLRNAAKEVMDIYPGLKAELEDSLGWRLTFRPTVLLIKDNERFQKMSGSNLIVAFAIPRRNLIVIDYSKMTTDPFTLEVTLRHELTHLLLHYYISRGNLPKWLDEGVAQWVSGGIAEIMADGRRSVLKEATLSKRFIPVRALTASFPKDRKSLLLAYEESKSIVEYISREFGTGGLRKILNLLRDGDEVDAAIMKALSIPLDELERRWHNYLRKRTTWFTYLSNNIYGILFSVAALLTIYGFIRLLMKRRAYKDEDETFSH